MDCRRYIAALNGRVVSNLDGANFPKVLTLLEQNHADIPNGQLAALRAEMSKFKECGQKEIIAMYMEEEDKVLVTLGRKAFDVSRMIVSVGFKHVDGSEYTKFEISITEEMPMTAIRHHLKEIAVQTSWVVAFI